MTGLSAKAIPKGGFIGNVLEGRKKGRREMLVFWFGICQLEGMKEVIKVGYVDAYFSGRVQGVGFRYSVLEIARGYEAAGYVKNMADGRVHLEVEGEAKELGMFLEAIEDQLSIFIRETEVDKGERERSFRDFVIG